MASGFDRTALKGKFTTGSDLNENAFSDLIDSVSHPTDVVDTVATEPTGGLPLAASVGYDISQDLDTVKVSVAAIKLTQDNFVNTHPTAAQVATDITSSSDTLLANITQVSDSLVGSYTPTTDIDTATSALEAADTALDLRIDATNATVSSLSSSALLKTEFATEKAGLTALINLKSNSSHQHSEYIVDADLTPYAKLTDLAAKASAIHTHPASDISGLDDLFTTPLEVQALINQNRVLLDETTILDDFYDKAEVDEQFRVKRWRTDQVSLFNETVLSLAAIPATNIKDEVNLSIAAVRVSMDSNKAGVLAELSTTRADLVSETNRATAAEVAIQADVDANEVTSTANILAEQNRASAAEVALGGRIDDVISNTDPAALDSLSEIVTQFQSNDSTLSSAITSALGTHTSELNAYISANDASLASEVARAVAAESSLQAGVTALQTDLATTQTSIATQGALVSANSTDIADNATAIATTAGTVSTLRSDVDSNDVDIAALQSSVGTTLPATIATINSAIATLQTQVGVDLQATIVSIQSELALLENKVNITIDQKVADLQEQVNACMALITILAGTSGSGTYDDLAAVTGVESATLAIASPITLSSPANEPLTGGFVSIPKNDTVLAGNGDYTDHVFKGTDNPNQLIAYNSTLGQWEWLWVDPGTGAISVIASQPDTDDSHVPEFWSTVDPGGVFAGLPDPLEVTPDQGSTSSVVNYLEALRFFTSGYVQQGLDYAGG